ncbi:succinylglutamate-semialdehyde dehydrogenase [Hydrocarboniphaga sp.]|uniref:succinylglutamate-semialdehyde dehydrogenase n=1 Tax=Hydrocarboniphaga sp. TaxID=2033016 RepID=UPI003D0B4D8B
MSSGWLYINGARQMGTGADFVSLDPTTADAIWEGNAASAADVQRAMEAARAAFANWGSLPFAEREAVVRCFATRLEANKEALAQIISQETGKPLWETRTEVATMIGKVDISVKANRERTGESDSDNAGIKLMLRHRPHGVVAVFGPYNFPGHLPNGHIVPALLAGNCVLFKPSELTPRTAEETIKLWEEAGIPPGVLQLIQGERATGEALAQHPDLDGLFFTGSSRTGLLLQQQFAAHPGKILALEMGGNNPLLIGEIADIKPAIYDIIQSAYLSSGQRCTCARRLYVPSGKNGDALIEALIAAIAKIRIAAPDAEPQPFMGPLISVRAADQILAAQTKLIALGAKPLVMMKRLPLGAAYVSPALLDVSAIEHLPDDENFGPLLQLIRYDSFDNAIKLANRTRYGLSAALLSDSAAQWQQFATQIKAGIINWNRQTTGASSAAPFGGVGQSGNHRPSAYYAADYCAYPVAMMAIPKAELPKALTPGIEL